MRQILFLIVAACILGCTAQSDKQQKIQQEIFNEFIESLDKIPLPLSYSSIGTLPQLSSDFDSLGYMKFKHDWAYKPFGILYSTAQYTVIVDLGIGDNCLVPFLMSYDDYGQKIDSINLFDKAGWDAGYQAVEYISFQEYRVIVRDTVKRWKIIEETFEEDASSLTVTFGEVQYTFTTSGEIEKK